MYCTAIGSSTTKIYMKPPKALSQMDYILHCNRTDQEWRPASGKHCAPGSSWSFPGGLLHAMWKYESWKLHIKLLILMHVYNWIMLIKFSNIWTVQKNLLNNAHLWNWYQFKILHYQLFYYMNLLIMGAVTHSAKCMFMW